MTSSTLAAAVLIVSLAACTQGSDQPATSEATGTPAGTAATSDPLPEPPATGAAPAVGNADATDECGAGKLDRWLNVLPTETVMAEIAETVGERAIRTYTQGDPITMDYSAARLNVELGEDGRIKLFRCG